MSQVAIFIVGAILFSATTWSTIAFGMTRVQELYLEDLRSSGAATAIHPESKYTYTEQVAPTPESTRPAVPPA